MEEYVYVRMPILARPEKKKKTIVPSTQTQADYYYTVGPYLWVYDTYLQSRLKPQLPWLKLPRMWHVPMNR